MNKEILFFMIFSFFAFKSTIAQETSKKKVLRGKVTSFKGEPVRNALFFVDSIENGTKSNKKGEYKLKLKPETKNVTVFSPDFGILSLPYSGEEKWNFSFPVDNVKITKKKLEIIGFETNKRIGSGAGRIIVFDEDNVAADYDNIFQMIDRNFTGITVFGNRITLRRGGSNTTLSGTAPPPLFIVDGARVSTIENIVPSQVKAVQLLKGAEAASLGSRADSGAIIITLRRD